MLSTQQQSITAAEWIRFFADSTCSLFPFEAVLSPAVTIVHIIQVCLSVWCRVLHGSALGSDPPTSTELEAYAGYDTI